ncbi:hypothetical protein D3C85_1717030 [compost metagenome]
MPAPHQQTPPAVRRSVGEDAAGRGALGGELAPCEWLEPRIKQRLLCQASQCHIGEFELEPVAAACALAMQGTQLLWAIESHPIGEDQDLASH